MAWTETRARIGAAASDGPIALTRAFRAALEDSDSEPRLYPLGQKLARELEPGSLPRMRLRVLRSFTVEPLAAPLVTWGLARGLHIAPSFGDYGLFEQELLSGEPAAPTDAVLLLARLEDLEPDLATRFSSLSLEDKQQQAERLVMRVRAWLVAARARYGDALVLVAGMQTPRVPSFGIADAMVDGGHAAAIHAINEKLRVAARDMADVLYINLDDVIARVGRDSAYDARMDAHARQPFSPRALGLIASHLTRVLAAAVLPRKKCIVLDCDNTLWGGIVGEDGPEGIRLGPEHPGSAFVAFQCALLDAHRRGILLAIASKNNEADVLEIFDDHPHQVLRREHIAAWSIGWGDKVAALHALAATINIGIDSLIFIDDSDFECALMAERLPEVQTIQAPADPLALAELVGTIESIDAVRVSDADRGRGAMYEAQAARHEAQKEAPSLDDFLHSLELELDIETLTASSSPALLERASQLTQRTNQLNATTRRYSVAEIEALARDAEVDVLTLRMRDRFGDYGVCGLAIVKSDEDEASIDSFLLSCRVLGRGAERALGVACEEVARARRVGRITAEYIASAKNQQVADLFDRLGFDRTGDGDHRRYDKRPSDSTLERPAWFKLTSKP